MPHEVQEVQVESTINDEKEAFLDPFLDCIAWSYLL